MIVTYTRGAVTRVFTIAGPSAGVIGGPLRVIAFSASITQTYSFYSISATVTPTNCT